MYKSKCKLPNRLTNKKAFSAASDIAFGGKSLIVIAEELGISIMQVRYHLLGETYNSTQSGWFQKYKNCLPINHMHQALESRNPKKRKKNQSFKKLKWAKQKKRALRILSDYEKYNKLAPIAKKYNMSESQISRIVRGIFHKEIYDYFHKHIKQELEL